ncbi:MAG: sensor histidine kinase [Alloprevotella sp.]
MAKRPRQPANSITAMAKHISAIIDCAFCLAFLPLMIYAFPVERWWGTSPAFFAGFVVWLYISYFLYRYFIVPRLFHKNRQLLYALAALVATLAVTFLFSTYKINSPYHHLGLWDPSLYSFPVWGVRQNQQAVWLHFILVVFFSFAVGMLTDAYRQRLARESAEHERRVAELAVYKAQINPHFLFNTLNTLYGLVVTASDKAVPMLEGFINLTKYMYTGAARDFLPVSEEADYIRQYIDLQKLRLNSLASVAFDCSVEEEAMPVPPMLLITFVENAFKHGISANDPSFIRISLRQTAGTLAFTVENSLFAKPGKSAVGGGAGIENCRRRLALLYPGRHALDIAELPCEKKDGAACGTFRVKLTLNS